MRKRLALSFLIGFAGSACGQRAPEPAAPTAQATVADEAVSLEELRAEAQRQWREATGEPTLHLPEANVYIPPEDRLIDTLAVAAAYDDDAIRVYFRFPTDNPSWYHQYWVYDGDAWQRYGESGVGPQPLGLYEDRFGWMIDDGSVDGFAEWGGYTIMHPGIRSRTDEVSEGEVQDHPWLGEKLGEDDVRKFLAESREGELDSELWRRVRPADELAALRAQGVFLDSIQWRAHRSGPLGYADNGTILDYRHSAEGRGMYTTNWSDDDDHPRWMFDPEQTGIRALRADRLLRREYTQDDPYFLAKDVAADFDPDHDWQVGDVIPHRLLRQPSGSRGAARGDGRWADGAWRVSIERELEADNPLDSKTLVPGQVTNVAFAVHSDATGARWHRSSMPLTLGLGTGANVEAVHVAEGLDEHEPQRWVEVPIFYVGQLDLGWLLDNGHPVHQRYQEARRAPLDADAVEQFTRALVAHELELLRERGIHEPEMEPGS